MKKYAIIYAIDGFETRYVGSILDYRDGGLTDPILMSKEEAENLLSELNNYVKNEFIGKTDYDNEQAHWTFERGIWGFKLDEFDLDEEQTYDVVFNDDEATNAKGMKATKVDAILYVKFYNGTNESYFADYKGGVVQVVCNETGDVVYEETVR